MKIIFDLARISQRAEALSALGQQYNVNVLIAVKAAAAKEILQTVQTSIQGFDISNANEFALTQGQGFHFITNCPVSDLAFIEKIEKNKFLISCSSFYYYQEMIQKKLPYVLRLQSTDLLTERSNFKSRFGFSREQVLALREQLKNDSNFAGFHFHHGSDKNTVGTYKSAVYAIRNLITELGITKKLSVNLGGGYINLTLSGIETVLKYARQELPSHTLYIEPGRYFTEGAGSCTAQVIDVQEEEGKLSASLNVSRECHLKWSQIEKIQVLNKVDANHKRKNQSITFFGSTCYENDMIGMGQDSELCNVAVGDTILLSNISGYSLAWNTSFNGIPAIEVQFLQGPKQAN